VLGTGRALGDASPSNSAVAQALGAANSASTPEAAALLKVVGAPQNLATPLSSFDRLLTPTEVFFVRSHFGPPSLDPARKLSIEGLVNKPLALTADELRSRFKETTVTAVLQCAGNGRALHTPRVPGIQWGHGAMGQATFTGARLKDILEHAGVGKDAAFVHLFGADAPPKREVPAFVRSIPLARALAANTLVAWGMNDAPLTLSHGAPLRLVVPGWAGDHWVKWLTHIALQKTEAEGFYMQTAYKFPIAPVEPGAVVKPENMRSLTTFPVKSVVARPAEGAKIPAGRQELSGCAFSGEAALAKVEVSTDGGKSWKLATLEGAADTGRWQVWRHSFDAQRGRLTVLVRATDKAGNVQPEKAAWNPSGYFHNAWHAVSWEVT
jgi:DMSO/TMAO reductase YedYZ molybdopterin-dependent catalytic subunit